jgi:hypothetical protein
MTPTSTGPMWGCLSAKRQIRRLISWIALRGHCPSLLPISSVVPLGAHLGQSLCEQAENASPSGHLKGANLGAGSFRGLAIGWKTSMHGVVA